MTDEELRRAMEFIVSSQARSEQRIDRLERVVRLAVRAGLRTRRDVRDQLAALTDAQMRNEERFAALAESQEHSDRRLDALIDIVRGQQGGQG
jgi:hypothetical protein